MVYLHAIEVLGFSCREYWFYFEQGQPRKLANYFFQIQFWGILEVVKVVKSSKAKMAQQLYGESSCSDALYALRSAAPIKETLLKGKGSQAAVPFDSDDDFPLLATKEEKEAFIADKTKLAAVNGLLRLKNSLISKYEKQAAIWKQQYRAIFSQHEQELQVVEKLKAKNRELRHRVQEGLDRNDEIRQALDELMRTDSQPQNIAVKDVVYLFRTGNMHRISMEHRRHMRSCIYSAIGDIEREDRMEREDRIRLQL